MTIPYVGRVWALASRPAKALRRRAKGVTTGVCVTCSRRFDVVNGTIAEHETSSQNERESVDA
jgi:hypothetical protein